MLVTLLGRLAPVCNHVFERKLMTGVLVPTPVGPVALLAASVAFFAYFW